MKDLIAYCLRSTLLFRHSTSADATKFGLGDQHSMILNQDGSVWSTVVSLRGLGLLRGVSNHHSFAKAIQSGATAVAAGFGYSIVLKQDGNVWGRGQNSRGQLGDGTTTGKARFSFVQIIPGAIAVAAGGYHSMVLTQEGCVWVTGWNKYGQLGIELPTVATNFFPVISTCLLYTSDAADE